MTDQSGQEPMRKRRSLPSSQYESRKVRAPSGFALVGAKIRTAKPVTSLSQTSDEPRAGGATVLTKPSVSFQATVSGTFLSSVSRQCSEMSPTGAECNNFPCIDHKKLSVCGHFCAVRGEFLVSVKGLRKPRPTVCKTVYSGSIPDVASNSLSRHTKT